MATNLSIGAELLNEALSISGLPTKKIVKIKHLWNLCDAANNEKLLLCLADYPKMPTMTTKSYAKHLPV